MSATPSPQTSTPPTPTQAETTFNTVFKSMQHWRNHKSDYHGIGIPDDIWRAIFQLEKIGYTVSELKRSFGLNSQQYHRKKDMLYPDDSPKSVPHQATAQQKPASTQVPTPTPAPSIAFCEAKQPTSQQHIPSLDQAAAKQTKKTVAHLKSTRPLQRNDYDTTTIIVECIHPDGQRLKIHTTNQHLTLVMQAFFQQAGATQ